jgi:diaminohydroxyphosphoribosylaminopyrimidine deaminase / 5-amino-6-(5-phosphoribosylamino)uracil reductase
MKAATRASIATQRSVDELWMERALMVGVRGSPEPNPHVGAVLVKDGRLLGAGHHERAGGPHAEVVALAAAGEEARGGTIYVTLEPCNHYGRTPPCVSALIAAGVTRVVIGCRDPNPNVTGFGAERLAEAQIEVVVGVCEERAQDLIRAWSRRHICKAGPVAVLHPRRR